MQASDSKQAAMQVGVLIPRPVPRCYDYAATGLALGDIVRVPFGGREIDGVVWRLGAADDAPPPAKLKSVLARHDVPALPQDVRDFVDWVAAYVMARRGAVLRQVMSVPAAFAPPPRMTAYMLGDTMPTRMTAARQRVVDCLQASEAAHAPSALAAQAGVSAGVLTAMEKCGALKRVARPPRAFDVPQADFGGVTLSPQQARAAQGLAGDGFAAHLLDGVTGSGKTEVYFEAIAESLRAEKQALILLPEIALTAQFLERFAARFGCAPVLWHSGLGAAERRRNWRGVANGEVRVLVGARSALFLPWRALGVIIVDEEHDGGYKQEDGVIYHARDMAVVRARFADCPIILASATPSLESMVNAESGKYQLHNLPSRHGAAKLPEIRVVDMRHQPPERGKWLAPPLVAGVRQALARGEQALLFLNRRGYAPLTLCRACGHRYACRQCAAWLVEHKIRRQLICHHCGAARPVPPSCDACGAEDELAACGPGVERIAEEALVLFPDARCLTLSSDHIGGGAALRETVARIADGGADVIIGTQIIAKGHHFPALTYVGVVDADLGLGNGDLRAAERTFQMLYQVAGRAGRARAAGYVDLQSYMPDHPVLQALASGDRAAFFMRESEARQAVNMPPFGRLAAVIVSGAEAAVTHQFARALARHIPEHPQINVLGPAPAPIARIRNRYRYRFLLRAARGAAVQDYLAQWLTPHRPRGSLRVAIDIDPISFL